MRRLLTLLLTATLTLPCMGMMQVRRKGLAPAAAATANLLSESWDPTGAIGAQDNAWSNTSSGGTIDPDSTTNPPIGSVTGFTTQCLKATGAVFDQPQAQFDLASAVTNEFYFRGYLYITGGPGDGDEGNILVVGATTISLSSGTSAARVAVSNTGGVYTLKFYLDSLGGQGSTTISLNTGYRVEFEINNNLNTYEFRVDGVTIESGSADPGSDPQRIILGIESSFGGGTLYWDKIGIGDNGWLGA